MISVISLPVYSTKSIFYVNEQQRCGYNHFIKSFASYSVQCTSYSVYVYMQS